MKKENGEKKMKINVQLIFWEENKYSKCERNWFILYYELAIYTCTRTINIAFPVWSCVLCFGFAFPRFRWMRRPNTGRVAFDAHGKPAVFNYSHYKYWFQTK